VSGTVSVMAQAVPDVLPYTKSACAVTIRTKLE